MMMIHKKEEDSTSTTFQDPIQQASQLTAQLQYYHRIHETIRENMEQ